MSWSLAPELSGADNGRVHRAVIAVVFVIGATFWTALSLAIPSTSAVDTLLTVVAATERERRLGVAVITVVPAVTLTLTASLAVAGGLVRDASSVTEAAAGVVVVAATGILGMSVSSILGDGVTRLLLGLRVAGAATCRGLAATVVIGMVGIGLVRLMGDVDAPVSWRSPLLALGVVADHALTHPALGLTLGLGVAMVGVVGVLAGSSAAKGRPGQQSFGAQLRRGRETSAVRVPWPVLEQRQLRRYQPNVGTAVLIGTATIATLFLARNRSDLFAQSVFFGLCSLLTTTAVTVAGVERRATWLYVTTGRLGAQVSIRLATYLATWLGFVLAFGGVLSLLVTGFSMGDVWGVLPLLGLELGVVLMIGAALPVSEEHGLSTMSGECAAIIAILLIAIGMPRLEFLQASPLITPLVAVGVVVAATAFHLWSLGRGASERRSLAAL